MQHACATVGIAVLALAAGFAEPVECTCVTGFHSLGPLPVAPGSLERPVAVAFDHAGHIIVADEAEHLLRSYTKDGAVLWETGGYGWDEGRLDGPLDLVVDPGFYIYVVDGGNRRIVRYDADGDYLDTPVSDTELEAPVAMELGSAGELLVVDADQQSVLVFSQFAESLEPIGYFGLGDAGLVTPVDVAAGPGRRTAVADPGAGSVCVYDEFGALMRRLTTDAPSFRPTAVVYDDEGNLFVADASGGLVAFCRDSGTPTASCRDEVLGEGAVPTALALAPEGLAVLLADGRLILLELEHGESQ